MRHRATIDLAPATVVGADDLRGLRLRRDPHGAVCGSSPKAKASTKAKLG